MSLEETLNLILPPIDNIHLHITGEFGEQRPNGKMHQGIDFNYLGGQKGINLTHPPIHSPVEGVVTFVKGNFGTIKIKDAEGLSHELLHTHAQIVNLGEVVKVGDMLGTMGGKGPQGYYQYPQHVHYQIKDPKGEVVNPHVFWDKKEDNLKKNHEVKKNSLQVQEVFMDSKEEICIFAEQKPLEPSFFASSGNILAFFDSQQATSGLI